MRRTPNIHPDMLWSIWVTHAGEGVTRIERKCNEGKIMYAHTFEKTDLLVPMHTHVMKSRETDPSEMDMLTP